MHRLVLSVLLLVLVAFPAAGAERSDIVEVVELTGTINGRTVEDFARFVTEVNENSRVKAVLIRVDSPGGGALATAALYEELGRLRVPVVAWCNHVCASGAYYALMAPSVRLIGVRSEAITGSIGVMATVVRYYRLLEWAKVDVEVYRSGVLKDAGNPVRPAEVIEREYLQSIVDEFASRFYAVVAKARGPKITDWPAIKAGRIFIGDRGVRVGLVDRVMSWDEAIRAAKELSGSKVVFTREELRKMAKQADEPYGRTPEMPSWERLWPAILEEIRRGEVIRIEYRLPVDVGEYGLRE